MPGGGRGGPGGGTGDGSSQLSPQTLKIIIPVILVSVGIIFPIVLFIAVRRIRKRHSDWKPYGDQTIESQTQAQGR